MEIELHPLYLDTKRGLEFTNDADQMLLLLKMLLDALEKDVQLIQSSLKSGDVKQANKLLHSLKGFLPVFCSDALADQLVSVEIISKTQSCEEVLAVFSDLAPKLNQLALESADYLVLAGAA